MHDKTKEQLLLENYDSPDRQRFIELVSTPGFDFLPNITGNRFIKTHLPFSLLPPSVMECKSKVSPVLDEFYFHFLLAQLTYESLEIVLPRLQHHFRVYN